MTTNTVVSNAIASRKASSALRVCNGSISYSQYKPQSKWDVLDDLEASFDASDLKAIKPYAKKFGVLAEFNSKANELGVSV